jgi:hypothetical protein
MTYRFWLLAQTVQNLSLNLSSGTTLGFVDAEGADTPGASVVPSIPMGWGSMGGGGGGGGVGAAWGVGCCWRPRRRGSDMARDRWSRQLEVRGTRVGVDEEARELVMFVAGSGTRVVMVRDGHGT